MSDDQITVSLADKQYCVDPTTIKQAEPGRYICRAWRVDTGREGQNWTKLDMIAKTVRGEV